MEQNKTRGSIAICLITGQPADDDCPMGCEVCLEEECEDYQIVYSG